MVMHMKNWKPEWMWKIVFMINVERTN